MKNSEITKNNLKLVKNIIADVKNLSVKELDDFFDSLVHFRNYSLNNNLILYFNGACNVKGFKQWQKLGRKVKKGSTAIWIFAPSIINVKNEDGEKTPKLVGFKSVPIFDYKDTEGKELPDFNLTEKSDIGIVRILSIANKLGFEVFNSDMPYNIGGYITNKGCIHLNRIHSEKEHVGVLLHEISHGILKHHLEDKKSTEIREQEAEILTHLICKAIGIERYSNIYLKCWRLDEEILKSFQDIDKAFKKFISIYYEKVKIKK